VAIGVMCILLVLGILFSVYWFSDDARTRRELKAVPTLAISAVQEGMVVRVTGRLRPAGDLVQSPLTGRHCAYFLAVVEERRKHGKTSSWSEIAREVHCLDFEVEDGTGVIHVRMDGCRVAVTRDAYSRSGTFDDATEAERAFLARHGHDSTGLLGFNRTLRYEEGVLEPGEEITVLGQVKTRVGPDGARTWVLGPTPDRAVLVSDDRGTVARR
jgi:hypothetical protein